MNDSKSIQEILNECAEMRGVDLLMDRTYEEFNLFIMDVLFADDLEGANLDIKVQKKYHHLVMKWDDISYGLALAFHIHCEELYGNDAQIQHYKDHIESMKHDIAIYEKRIHELENHHE